jgi:GMP synthase-like glutamine amidotransferase
MRTRIDTRGEDPTGPKLACLHHLESPFLGAAAAPLATARLDHRDRLQGDPLPDLNEIDGLISFGGAQSVTEIDRYPYLLEEVELLREAFLLDVPVLGICLGAQLLAHAHGGTVRRLPKRAVVWAELRHAAADPLIGALPDPVHALHWNEDAIEPPPGATELLERGGLGCAAFRIESAWGLQFHADVDGPILDGWYDRYGDWLAEAAVDPVAARAADAQHLPGQAETARGVFGTFAELTHARAARTRAPR